MDFRFYENWVAEGHKARVHLAAALSVMADEAFTPVQEPRIEHPYGIGKTRIPNILWP